MGNNSKKLKVAVIREELVELTGDAIAALILNQAILAYESTISMDQKNNEIIKEFIENGDIEIANKIKEKAREGWFYKSPNSFYKEIMISSRATCKRRLDTLTEQGYIIKGGQYFKEVKNRFGQQVEDTWWTVDINKIRKDLANLGYALHGYKIWNDSEEETPETPSQDRGVHGEQGDVHREQGDIHHDQGGVHSEQGGVHDGHQHRLLHRGSIIDLSKDTSKSLSIIGKLEVPFPVQQKLISNLDRLIDDSIDLGDIELIYNAEKDKVNEYQFAKIINNVLTKTKKPINDITNLVSTAIKNELSYEPKKIQNTEVVPDWIKEQKARRYSQVELPDTEEIDNEKESQEIAEILKKYSSQTKQVANN